MGRYISEFQLSLQGIYTRTARIIYPVDYVKTYSCIQHAGHSGNKSHAMIDAWLKLFQNRSTQNV